MNHAWSLLYKYHCEVVVTLISPMGRLNPRMLEGEVVMTLILPMGRVSPRKLEGEVVDND